MLGALPDLPVSSVPGPSEQVIVAPALHELTARWLGDAIAEGAQRLADAGLIWVIVPPRWRHQTDARLRNHGLILRDTVVLTPPWPDTEHLVPLRAPVLRDALARHLHRRRSAAWAGGAIVATQSGRRLARRLAPGCALVAGRVGSTPPHWLQSISPGAPPGAMPLVSRGRRSDAQVAILLAAPDAGRPGFAVKAGLNVGGRVRVRTEAQALAAHGPLARRAGAEIPVALNVPGIPDWALVTNALDGRPAASVLAAAPHRWPGIARSISDWLLNWNQSTLTTTLASAEMLVSALTGPARSLMRLGRTTAAYLAAMEELAHAIRDRPMPYVATHNDLTMTNVIVREDGIGIVDWETAAPVGVPLADLFYTLTDAVARATRCRPAQALSQHGHDSGRSPNTMNALTGEHARALGLTDLHRRFAFHSCWLHHAGEELKRGVTNGPFSEVVATIGSRRILWPPST